MSAAVRSLGAVVVLLDDSEPARLAAAGIWARATASRDGDPEPASAQEALPIIDGALLDAGAALHIARRDDAVVGFAIVAPSGDAREIHYLGVDPTAWGAGVGAALLRDIDERAATQRCPRLELWVYDDNERAVAVYERQGWTVTGEARTHARSGRRERRFVLTPGQR